MNASQLKKFRGIILNFYKNHGRHDLPWRNTRDPYKILVSEIMLQQTQVSRVIKKYPEFIQAFPTPQALAKAPLKRVLGVWQGMGYNRRVIALKKIADRVTKEHNGEIPDNPTLLEKFPGIGENTARAIVAFAFDKPSVFIETNIRRTYIHHFFPNARNIPDKKLLSIIEKTVDLKNSREWYYALMDYGSALSKQVKNPNRKSKHYVKQKPFKGSNREVRGLIIRTLLEKGSLSTLELKTYIDRPKLSKNLNDLVSDGFLNKQGKVYTFAH